MTFTYDLTKATRNYRIHHISFDTAITFSTADDNPNVEFDEDHSSSDEARYRGTFRYNDHYLFIVYIMRGEVIRIISALLATKGEIKRYYERRGM